MARENQASSASEIAISVDMNEADTSKAVTRRNAADIAQGVRDDAEDRPRTKAEKELFKRMGRLERNLTKQFDQQRAADQAEHQRELSALRERLDKVNVERGGQDDAADAAHDVAIGVLKDKLAAAYEKGDSQASADITLQISKLDAQFWAKKAAAAGVTTREAAGAAETARRHEQQRLSPQQEGRRDQGPTAAGARFIKANDEWWEDPDFHVETAAANAIYLNLVNEGFDAKDSETYKEVAKQMKVKFPSLDVQSGRKGRAADDADDENGETQGNERQERHPAAAVRMEDRGASSHYNRGGARTLTKQEIETMKACRLDPESDKDVVTFLKEAVALESAS